MIAPDTFDKRVKALYASQKKMAAPKKWKSGKRAGMLRHPGFKVEFSERQLHSVLMGKVGFTVILCPYCHAPIDIVSLTLDHIVPRSQGGRFSLDNMQCTCQDCNARKGDMSHEAFAMLMAFARKAFSAHDYNTLLSRLKAASAGSGRRFFRDKKKDEQPGAYLPPAEQMPLEEEF